MRGTVLGVLFLVSMAIAPAIAVAQEAILLIRHAEQTPPPEIVLTEAGRLRAAGLADRLRDSGVAAIFTTTATRTQETAAPTARALGITPKVVAPQDVEGLVRRVSTEHAGDRVLVVNHALNLPEILRAFGHRDPPTIRVDEYDVLYVIVPRAGAPPIVLRFRL